MLECNSGSEQNEAIASSCQKKKLVEMDIPAFFFVWQEVSIAKMQPNVNKPNKPNKNNQMDIGSKK